MVKMRPHIPEFTRPRVPESPSLHVPTSPRPHVPESPSPHAPTSPRPHVPESRVPRPRPTFSNSRRLVRSHYIERTRSIDVNSGEPSIYQRNLERDG